MKVAPPPPPVKAGEEASIKCIVPLNFYSPDKLQIHILAIYNHTQYNFVMKFHSAILYRKVRKYIFNNRRKNIIVSGVWYPDDISNTFRTEVSKAEQIVAV